MRVVKAFAFFVLAVSMMWAQSTSSPTSTTSDVADQLKQLRATLEAQQKQIEQQQEQIQKLQEQLTTSSSKTAQLEPTVYHPGPTTPQTTGDTGAPPKESPLSVRIGGTEWTPGGFVDLENIFRSTNTGNSVGTSFNAIPFSNTVQGHLTEYRMTAQHSRVNLKMHGVFGSNDITGYAEADFNGNDPANVFVSTNPHTNRLRLYWLDLKRGKWEFLGGQGWSLLVPNRNGISPMPADVFVGLETDANAHVGIPYVRDAQFRVGYHPNEHWAVAFGIENPQQFVGSGEVIFPFAFNAQLGPQFDAANNAGTPNAHPDFVSKLAYDNKWGDRNIHFEVNGLITSKKATILPVGTGVTEFASHSATGGGIGGALGVDVIKNVKFVANTFWSEGGGRYLTGLGPDAIVIPTQTGPAAFNADVDLVESFSGMGGFEFTATPNNVLYAYYGGDYFDRNAFLDVTNPVPNRIGGFGGINSPNSANRAIQEATFGWNHTFWKSPQYGAVQLLTSYSYLTRAPWFVAMGAPKNAHLSMVYVDFRYILP
jgi:hypothetical protein